MVETFSVEALIFIIILVFYVLTSHIVEFRKIPYVHESSMAILMGIITAAIAKYALHQEIQFNNEIFFTIILPPIIFSAGYSLRKSLFFENFAIVAFLGIIGTIIGFLSLTSFLIFINSYFFQALTLTEILLMSAVLSATDTVAAMSLIKVN
jgi:sodium/hydrogen exchanger-like protein 6/7